MKSTSRRIARASVVGGTIGGVGLLVAACAGVTGLDGYYIDQCLAGPDACSEASVREEASTLDAGAGNGAVLDAPVNAANDGPPSDASAASTNDAVDDIVAETSTPESGNDTSAPTEAGDASAGCLNGEQNCGGVCLNVNGNDANNCGACGHNCLGSPCSAGMCVPTTLATGQSGASAIAVDEVNVYWANDEPVTGSVMQCAASDCKHTMIPLATNQKSPLSLVIDAANVYWGNLGAGSVVKCLIGGCSNQPKPLAVGITGLAGIAVDAASVYWTDDVDGVIAKCPLTGCGGGVSSATLNDRS